MADVNRTTLAVAVAGIAATALVGLAGTAAAWLSARDDRQVNRELAREERRYDRRVSVYLDAIRLVEKQRIGIGALVAQLRRYRPALESDLASLDIPWAAWSQPKRRYLPLPDDASAELKSRLRAFGSPTVLQRFEQTQIEWDELPFCMDKDRIDVRCSITYPERLGVEELPPSYGSFSDGIIRLEELIHTEVG